MTAGWAVFFKVHRVGADYFSLHFIYCELFLNLYGKIFRFLKFFLSDIFARNAETIFCFLSCNVITGIPYSALNCRIVFLGFAKYNS